MIAEYFQRHWLRIVLSLVILGVFYAHVVKWYQFELVDRLENIAYDARLLSTMPRTHDDRIVIIDIDERSLAAQGRWPWSRDKMALLLDRLFDDYEAHLVAFDIVFAEREESSGIEVLDALEKAGLGHLPGFRKQSEKWREELNTAMETVKKIDENTD